MSDITKLNVGGTNITTRLSVLTKEPESALAAMFTGYHVTDKDEDGRHFIDCNAVTFQYVLDFLRCGKLPSHDQAVDVYNMAVHFGLKSLQKELEKFKSVQCSKKIDAMKNGPMSEQYKELKEKAVDALKISRSFDDIYLMITAKRTGYSCQGPINIRQLQFHHYAKISVDFDLSDEMLWCLTEELQWLGFGKYIDYFHSIINKAVPTCGRFFTCSLCHNTHIWLLSFSTHKKVH